MKDLQGKVAVITGAAGGIGRALCVRAARAGMKLVLADRDARGLEALAAELTGQGAALLAVRTDVADPASLEELADRSYEAFGAAHLLVNNAGIAYANSAWETPLEEYRRNLDVNLYGVIHGVRAFVPRMLAAGEPGHIVNVASAAGLLAVAGLGAYSAAKFAVVGFSESLFQDLRERKARIGVSLVCPSWVRTAIASGSGDSCDAYAARTRAQVYEAVQKGLPAEDVAQQVLEAVEADRFYVLTHESTRAGVRARSRDLLDGNPPTPFPIV
jgi:NAD(P)-dependent dehydrogenase (short-subunit alcohol dehydrogenase family)